MKNLKEGHVKKGYLKISVIALLMLLAFFLVAGFQRAPASGVTAGTSAPGIIPGTSALNCPGCREIDETWLSISNIVRGTNEIWDDGWKRFEQVYPAAVPAEMRARILNLGNCRITNPGTDSTSKGTRLNGALESGVASETNSFTAFPSTAYSTVTGRMEEVKYGTTELVQMLELTSCALEQRYNKKLMVKDLSLPSGGIVYRDAALAQQMPPEQFRQLDHAQQYQYVRHRAHQSGLEVDIGYFALDGGQLRNTLSGAACGGSICTTQPSADYTDSRALEANWFLLKVMNEVFPVDYVAFDRNLIWELHKYACQRDAAHPAVQLYFNGCGNIPRQLSEDSYTFGRSWRGALRHVDGHANHFHVATKCPQDDYTSGNCRMSKAERGIRTTLLG